jgi:hypothetical protein
VGVPEEAGKDNRTMRTCVQELRRCQEGPIKPNFLVLLGDGYGWRPLPETIPTDVFEKLEREFTAKNAEIAKILDAWYQQDGNAVPPSFVRARSKILTIISDLHAIVAKRIEPILPGKKFPRNFNNTTGIFSYGFKLLR